MDLLVKKLGAKLKEWTPKTAAEVRARVAEMIVLADQNALGLMRSRAIEQEVLDTSISPRLVEVLSIHDS